MRTAQIAAGGIAVCIVFLPLCVLSQSVTCDAISVNQSASTTTGKVLYTGELDGLLGSKDICSKLTPADCDALIHQKATVLKNCRKQSKGILVGMGDNFGPFGLDSRPSDKNPYIPKDMIDQRLHPDYSKDRVVEFMGDAYDAVVPGKEDFTWGVEYLRHMADKILLSSGQAPVPLIANNLTIQAKPDSECLSYPTPTPALPLLPNQVSSPISSAAGGAGGASAGGATAGGASGGGKGKGKGSGGGGAAAAAGAAGGGTGAPGAAGACPGAGGAGTTGGAGSTILTRKQAKALNILQRPSLVWPDAGSLYPWSVSMAVSIPVNQFNTASALMCQADPDPSKVDEVVPATCIVWPKVKPDTATGADSTSESTKSASPNETDQFTLVDAASVPINAQGDIFQSLADEQSKGKNSQYSNADRAVAGMLFPGSSVKLCLALSPKPPSPDVTATHDNQSSGHTPSQDTASPRQGASPNYRCTPSPIAVQRTLFQSAWIIPDDTGPGSYAIFGALASDTLNGLSDANKDWAPEQPTKRNPTMQVSVGDPSTALTQAVNAFNLLNPGKASTALVLAQMTPAEAKSLADSLGSNSHASTQTQVNLILSAADPVEASPDSTITLPTQARDVSVQGRFIPVITPEPIFQKADCLDNPKSTEGCVARTEVSSAHDSMTLKNSPATTPKYRQAAKKARSSNNTFCDNQTKTTWECRVLLDMRAAMYDTYANGNPEIAILEEKDFDYVRSGIDPDAQYLSGSPSADQMIEALWNAGNLTRVTLLGSTLTAILNQNRSNQSQTYQTLPSVRQSEQLRILGIFQVGQAYYVNGIPLDSTKLYAIATSDNLATTTSDYTSLASQDQNLPEVFWLHGRTKSIAEIMYVAEHGSAALPSPELLAQADLEVRYDSLKSGQITQTDRKQAAPQLTPFALSLTHSMRTVFTNTAHSSLSDLGKQAELGSLWHVAVQQLAVGFSNARPSQSDQLIGTNLGGVTNPNVVSPHSDTLTAVYDSRAERYFHRGLCNFCASDAGIDGQINFTRSIQGSTTPSVSTLMTTAGLPVPTTSISYPANTYVASPFLEFQMNNVDFWKPIVIRPALVTTNVASLKQYLASGNTALSLPPLDFVLSEKRTITLGEDIGTRFEWSDFTYVEFGYSHQTSYNVLSDVSVPGVAPCQLNSSSTLSTCAGKLPATSGVPLAPSYSTYIQNGGYVLYSLTQEFPTNPFKRGYPANSLNKALFLYQGTAFGNFFAYGPASTSSALTRYAFAMNNTLQVQLPSNFTFGPSYNWFFFQANEHGVGSSLHRSSISAQLNYSFDWHTGMPLTKTLVGKTQ